MAIYRLGSVGEEVRRIQERLAALGLYAGLVDGKFGGGTDAAVRRFQQANRLDVDGEVGEHTWAALFDEEALPTPSLQERPLAYRCLALTGAFETGAPIPDCFAGVSGDFDGQGISLGVCQWNLGQGSLQPLLAAMLADHPRDVKAIFREHADELAAMLRAPRDEQLAFARSIQHPVKHFVHEPWRGMFRALGRTAAFQEVQLDHATALFQAAAKLCQELGLGSERAFALLFDVVVQNGSISPLVKARIRAAYAGLPRDLAADALEVARMRIVANLRADASNPRWIEDVRARKLCCANGTGVVHGIPYDLEAQFAIRLAPAALPRGRKAAGKRS